MRVLIVEDDEDIRTALKELLEDSHQWQVIEASNGREALDLLIKNPLPNVILVDNLMPVMDGVEFINKIKGENQFKKIPVILLTASRNVTHINVPVVKKPFDIFDLLDKIKKVATC